MDDVQGLVHCHTLYSDGKNSVEEMARGADALGMKYMTITDHSPTAHYAGGLPLDRLKRQWDEIAQGAGEGEGPVAARARNRTSWPTGRSTTPTRSSTSST